MLLQYCSPYGKDISAAELDEEFGLAQECMKDEGIELTGHKKYKLKTPLTGAWQVFSMMDDEASTGVLTRVRAQLFFPWPGIKPALGVGDNGRGRSIDTYAIEADDDLGDQVELHIRSMYGRYGGFGYEEVSAADFKARAEASLVPDEREEFLWRAVELELAKGPLACEKTYQDLVGQYERAVGHLDSFSGQLQTAVFGAGPFYVNALEHLLRLLSGRKP